MKRVLIVDDSRTMREMISFTLKGKYETIESFDGVDAIDKFKSNKIDMVITDLNMPNMDGITLIKELRKLSKVPIITLTTESSNEKKDLGKQAGASGWIIKPFVPDKLLSVIQKLIG